MRPTGTDGFRPGGTPIVAVDASDGRLGTVGRPEGGRIRGGPSATGTARSGGGPLGAGALPTTLGRRGVTLGCSSFGGTGDGALGFVGVGAGVSSLPA